MQFKYDIIQIYLLIQTLLRYFLKQAKYFKLFNQLHFIIKNH